MLPPPCVPSEELPSSPANDNSRASTAGNSHLSPGTSINLIRFPCETNLKYILVVDGERYFEDLLTELFLTLPVHDVAHSSAHPVLQVRKFYNKTKFIPHLYHSLVHNLQPLPPLRPPLLYPRRDPHLPPPPEAAGGDAVPPLDDAVADRVELSVQYDGLHCDPKLVLPWLSHHVRVGVVDDLPPEPGRPLPQGYQDLVPGGVHLAGHQAGEGVEQAVV